MNKRKGAGGIEMIAEEVGFSANEKEAMQMEIKTDSPWKNNRAASHCAQSRRKRESLFSDDWLYA